MEAALTLLTSLDLCPPKNHFANYLKLWSNDLLECSIAFRTNKDSHFLIRSFLRNYYGYDLGPVFFRLDNKQFSPFYSSHLEQTLEYFFKSSSSEEELESENEKINFFLHNWKEISFEIEHISCFEKNVLISGKHIFTETRGKKTIANFSILALRKDMSLKILLHHIS